MRNIPRRHPAAVIAVVAAAVAILACSQPQQQQQMAPFKVGATVGTATEWGVFAGIEKGFYEQEGLKVEVETFSNPGDVNAALLAGRLDAAVGSLVAPILAKAQGVPLTMIMAGHNTRGEYNNWFAALPNSRVKTIQDLKGGKINTVSSSFFTHAVATSYISRHGILNEVEFVGMNFPESYAALKTGRADVAAFVEPFFSLGNKASMEEFGQPMNVIFTYEDSMGMDVVALSTPGLVTQDSITSKADSLRKYVKGTLAANNWGMKPENLNEVHGIIVKWTGAPEETVKASILPPQTLDGMFPANQLRVTQELMIQAGQLNIPTPYPDDQLIDTRFLK
jgi:NitT/TauT family transport system substrate-binding protein